MTNKDIAWKKKVSASLISILLIMSLTVLWDFNHNKNRVILIWMAKVSRDYFREETSEEATDQDLRIKGQGKEKSLAVQLV